MRECRDKRYHDMSVSRGSEEQVQIEASIILPIGENLLASGCNWRMDRSNESRPFYSEPILLRVYERVRVHSIPLRQDFVHNAKL